MARRRIQLALRSMALRLTRPTLRPNNALSSRKGARGAGLSQLS